MFYIYDNISNSPNLEGIHSDITISEMTDKNILWCRWDEDIKELRVEYDNILSLSDKHLLDDIVGNNL